MKRFYVFTLKCVLNDYEKNVQLLGVLVLVVVNFNIGVHSLLDDIKVKKKITIFVY